MRGDGTMPWTDPRVIRALSPLWTALGGRPPSNRQWYPTETDAGLVIACGSLESPDEVCGISTDLMPIAARLADLYRENAVAAAGLTEIRALVGSLTNNEAKSSLLLAIDEAKSRLPS